MEKLIFFLVILSAQCHGITNSPKKSANSQIHGYRIVGISNDIQNRGKELVDTSYVDIYQQDEKYMFIFAVKFFHGEDKTRPLAYRYNFERLTFRAGDKKGKLFDEFPTVRELQVDVDSFIISNGYPLWLSRFGMLDNIVKLQERSMNKGGYDLKDEYQYLTAPENFSLTGKVSFFYNYSDWNSVVSMSPAYDTVKHMKLVRLDINIDEKKNEKGEAVMWELNLSYRLEKLKKIEEEMASLFYNCFK